MILKEVDINIEKPQKPGRYVVRTVSTGPLETKRILEARLSISSESRDEKDKYKWDVKNQVVTHWFKEVTEIHLVEDCEHRYAVLVPNGNGLMRCTDCNTEF